MIIEVANKSDVHDLTEMALMLWPDNSWDVLEYEMEQLLKSDRDALFVARVGDKTVGFAHICLRQDYVEGSQSTPVGYIEAIFIKEQYRNQGIAKRLVQAGEAWSKSRGCVEMGSDTEIDNVSSQQFHKKIGFSEAGRIVAFIKKIE